MHDVRESEGDSVVDLEAFLDAELSYHDKCREVLMQLRSNWPAGQQQEAGPSSRRPGRARSNTAHSYDQRYEPVQEESHGGYSEPRPIIGSNRTASYQTEPSPPRDTFADPVQRPAYSRTPTFEGPTQIRRDQSPGYPGSNRLASDSAASLRNARSQLRNVSSADPYANHDSDDSVSYGRGSPERAYTPGDGTAPPYRNGISRAASSNSLNTGNVATKKGPPPPPPSRAKKPPPPPPPMRRIPSAPVNL